MKRKRKWLFPAAIFSGGILLGSLLCFYFMPRTTPADSQTRLKEVERTLEFITTHTLCNHTSTYTEPVTKVYSDRTQIQEAFPEWTIQSVTDEKIVLTKTASNYCPEHYFAYLSGKKIYIETLNGDKKLTIDVATYSFTGEESKTLTEGVYLNGNEMYTAFIEDFTS